MYGIELIIDLHECDPSAFTRDHIKTYLRDLCDLIKMERADLHWWDYEGQEEEYKEAPPHLKGTSVVQFIMTSTIVIHTLDELKCAYINIFTCNVDGFDASVATEFTKGRFGGKIRNTTLIERF